MRSRKTAMSSLEPSLAAPAAIIDRAEIASAPMTVDELIADIGMVVSFLQQQAAMGIDNTIAQQAQARTINGKIGALRSLAAPEATRLLQALQQGPWAKAELEAMVQQVNDRIASTDDALATGSVHKSQTCAKFEQYLTAEDWTMLCDGSAPMFLKIACVVKRALKLGLYWPGANTSSRWACILHAGCMQRQQRQQYHQQRQQQ